MTFDAICQDARKLSLFQLGEFAVLEDSPSFQLLVSTCLCYLCQEVIKELFSLDRCVISFLIGCRIFQELLLISEISSHPHVALVGLCNFAVNIVKSHSAGGT